MNEGQRSSLTIQKKRLHLQISCKESSVKYIGQTSRQLKVRLTGHKRKRKKTRPSNETALKKLEWDSAIALHASAKGLKVDFDNTETFSTGFRTHTERPYAKSLTIGTCPNCSNRNEGAETSAIWMTLTTRSIKHPNDRKLSLTSVDSSTDNIKCNLV